MPFAAAIRSRTFGLPFYTRVATRSCDKGRSNIYPGENYGDSGNRLREEVKVLVRPSVRVQYDSWTCPVRNRKDDVASWEEGVNEDEEGKGERVPPGPRRHLSQVCEGTPQQRQAG